MTEIREDQPGVENTESPVEQPQAPELTFQPPDCTAEEAAVLPEVPQPVVEAAPAAAPTPVKKRRPVALIAVGVTLLVLALLAGGGYFGLRYYEDQLFQTGTNLLAQKDWAGAEAAFDQGLSLRQTGLMEDPNQFVRARGLARYYQGKFDGALADFAAVQAIYPEDKDEGILAAKMDMYLKTDRFEDALKTGEQILVLNKEVALPYALRAEKAYKEGKLTDALAAAEEAIKYETTYAMAYTVRGNKFAWEMDTEAALSDLNKALELAPKQAEALAARAFVYYYRLEYEKLKADAQSLKETAPDSAYALWAEGLVNLYDYKKPEARALFDQAIAKDGTRPEFFLHRANSYVKTEEEKQALADIDSALKLNPDFAPAIAGKVMYDFQHYNTVDMNAEADRLAKLAPKSYFSNMVRSAQLIRDLEWEKALVEVELAIKAQPGPVAGYLMRGDLYLAQKKFDLAKADYEKAKELFPQSLAARFGLAQILNHQSKYEDAIKVLDEIATIDPNSMDMFATKAAVLLNNEDNRKAAKLLEEAFKIDPTNASLLLARALVSMTDGDSMKAMSDVNKAAEYYPNDPGIMVFRAMVYVSNNDTKHAQEELRKAEKINKKLSDIFLTRAMIHMGAGEHSRAMEAAKKAISLAPWSAEAYTIVGQAQYAEGRNELAIESLKKSVELKPEQDSVYFTLGMAQWDEGDLEGAVDSFEKLIANKRKSSLELVDIAEPSLSFLRRIPAAVDGKRTMQDKIDNYRITFPETWIPRDPSDYGNGEFALTPKGKKEKVSFQAIIIEVDFANIPASLYGTYLLQEEIAPDVDGYKFVSSTYLSGDTMTAAVNTYEFIFHKDDGSSYPARERMYVFSSGKYVAILFYTADVLMFEDYEQEANELAKTFQFLE